MTRTTLRPIHVAAPVLSFLLPLASTAAAPASAREQLAQASPAPAAGATRPAPPGQASPQGMPERPAPTAWVQARIEELHKKLAITQAQEPQFKAFADVMRANAETMRGLFAQRAQNPDTTALGRLRWYAQVAAAHAEATQKLVTAFEPLYQSLSDTQKKAADSAFEAFRVRMERRNAG